MHWAASLETSKVLRLGILLLAIMLAGCSSLTDLKTDISERMFGRKSDEPPTPLKDIQASSEAKILWHASVGASPDYDFMPAVDKNAVYTASQSGDITRIDPANGQVVWRVNAGEGISGGAGAGENLVLAGTNKGMVLAFDQATGKVLWKSKVASEILSAPQIFGGVVVVRSGDSRIYGIDAADGKRKWVYERVTPTLSLRSSAGVVIDGQGVAFVGFAGGKLAAINTADGKVIWEASVALPKGTTEIERIADITSLPVFDGRYVYAAAFQGRVVGIERASGQVLWNRDISSYKGLASDGSVIYVTQSTGTVYALDYASGKTYWRQGDLQHRQTSAPVGMGRFAVVGDLEGWVHALSRDDGTFVARIKTDSSAVMTQLINLGDGVVLAQTRGGGLYAIKIK
jgi:outer membrane protein assembly factor BamB